MLFRSCIRISAAFLLAATLMLWLSSWYRTLVLSYDGVHGPFVMSTQNKLWLGYVRGDPDKCDYLFRFHVDPRRLDTYDEDYNASLYRFLGFAGGVTNASYFSFSIAIPYWFLSLVSAAFLAWTWRKTRPLPASFPVEPARPEPPRSSSN